MTYEALLEKAHSLVDSMSEARLEYFVTRYEDSVDKKPLEVEKLFGLWKDHDNKLSPGEVVRILREGRKF